MVCTLKFSFCSSSPSLRAEPWWGQISSAQVVRCIRFVKTKSWWKWCIEEWFGKLVQFSCAGCSWLILLLQTYSLTERYNLKLNDNRRYTYLSVEMLLRPSVWINCCNWILGKMTKCAMLTRIIASKRFLLRLIYWSRTERITDGGIILYFQAIINL